MPRADPGHLGALEHAGQAHAAAVRHRGAGRTGATPRPDLLAHEAQRVGAHVEAQQLELDAHALLGRPRGRKAERRELLVEGRGAAGRGRAGAAAAALGRPRLRAGRACRYAVPASALAGAPSVSKRRAQASGSARPPAPRRGRRRGQARRLRASGSSASRVVPSACRRRPGRADRGCSSPRSSRLARRGAAGAMKSASRSGRPTAAASPRPSTIARTAAALISLTYASPTRSARPSSSTLKPFSLRLTSSGSTASPQRRASLSTTRGE